MTATIRSGATRARVHAAALELFTERGYAGTSLQQIVDRLGSPRRPSITTTAPNQTCWPPCCTRCTPTWRGCWPTWRPRAGASD